MSIQHKFRKINYLGALSTVHFIGGVNHDLRKFFFDRWTETGGKSTYKM